MQEEKARKANHPDASFSRQVFFFFLIALKKNEGEKRRAEKVRTFVVAERTWRKSPIQWRELKQWINAEFPNRESVVVSSA